MAKLDEDDLFARLRINSESDIAIEPTEIQKEAPIKIKDYTFGAKLRSQAALKEKTKEQNRENILYKTIPKKIDTYMSSSELAKFSIKAFSITKSLPGSTLKKENKNAANATDDELTQIYYREDTMSDKNQKLDSGANTTVSRFYRKILSKGSQESLNNLKIYLDYEVENLLVSMENHYSSQLTDILFNHFHLKELLRILRTVFFLRIEPLFENFLHEALMKV